MRVLVVGSGARDHAVIRALAEDSAVSAVGAAPGGPGTADLAEQIHLDDMASSADVKAAVARWQPDLVIIGPAAALVAGVADAVRGTGTPCFGPSAAAARIEGSKIFAKEIIDAVGAPTGRWTVISGTRSLVAELNNRCPPYVIKDDGLAAGLGVVVTNDARLALEHAESVFELGRSVIVEEFLAGPEVSLFCLVHGTSVVPLLPAQDFKRFADGDRGPNTGGMGSYAPLGWLPQTLVDEAVQTIVIPVVRELDRRGSPFTGLLYAGLVLTGAGPRVLEFNCRFGDPEAVVVLALLDTPLGDVLLKAAVGRLDELPPLRWSPDAAVAVLVTAGGYPQVGEVGQLVSGADGPDVFHIGTRRSDDGRLYTTDGRVLVVLGVGPNLPSARQCAYRRVARIKIEGAHYRTDIGANGAVVPERLRPATGSVATSTLGHEADN